MTKPKKLIYHENVVPMLHNFIVCALNARRVSSWNVNLTRTMIDILQATSTSVVLVGGGATAAAIATLFVMRTTTAKSSNYIYIWLNDHVLHDKFTVIISYCLVC